MASFNIIATICFVFAIFHTFLVKQIHHYVLRLSKKSPAFRFLILLSEVELVFIFWSLIFLVFSFIFVEQNIYIEYFRHLSFGEPLFVFFIMLVCSTQFILGLFETILAKASFLVQKTFGSSFGVSTYVSALIIGPLLGSFVTEPAAMTVTSYFLLRHFFNKGLSMRFKYASLGLLFVNISIGGALTPFAAPPILMVAFKWGWGLKYMIFNFGLRALSSVIISTLVTTFVFRNELNQILPEPTRNLDSTLSFNFKSFLRTLHFRGPILVALFLLGLVILGGQQKWWLEPLIKNLSSGVMFLSSTALTSVIDNAALTYLGSQVENLSELMKFSLVAGSLVGGGLTIIANAPNPVGVSVLGKAFGIEGISPLRLFLFALFPTFIALVIFGSGVL